MTQARWQLTEVVGPNQGGQPLRSLLQRTWLLPKRLVHYLRIRQNVVVNGQYRPMNRVVQAGDMIQMTFQGDEFRTPNANQYLPTAHPQLQVLYENRNLLVVNKPRGQKTHPNEDGETGTLMNDATGYLAGQAYMVHRIDKQTSGAVIIAKNPVVVPVLDRLIAAGKIHREYLAIVDGPLKGSGEWQWPIGDDPSDPWRRMVNGQGAQPAVTHYQSIAASQDYSLVRLRLETGRTHQLRVHLAHSGHPIVGDPIYNPGSPAGMLLHAACQQLIVPFSMHNLVIQAPLPDYFAKTLVKYNLESKSKGDS